MVRHIHVVPIELLDRVQCFKKSMYNGLKRSSTRHIVVWMGNTVDVPGVQIFSSPMK